MYPNGEVPLNLLVSRPCAGKDICLMMPGTAAKYDRLVALAQAEYGWTPLVSGPSDAYRTIGMQWNYWNTLPYPQAAFPSTSSHGGTYNGVESGALDIGNWGEVGREAFFDLARRAGFEPGYFDGTGGKPDEPWHIIDWSPWDAPANAPLPSLSEEDDMIRISAPGRGVAVIGPGYFRGLTSTAEVEAAAAITTKTLSGSDADFDAWATIARDGVSAAAAVARQEGRPLKLYTNQGKLIVVGPNGKSWDVPDGYRALLEAMGLVGPNVIRELPDNEKQFLEMILGLIGPAGDAPKA